MDGTVDGTVDAAAGATPGVNPNVGDDGVATQGRRLYHALPLWGADGGEAGCVWAGGTWGSLCRPLDFTVNLKPL